MKVMLIVLTALFSLTGFSQDYEVKIAELEQKMKAFEDSIRIFERQIAQLKSESLLKMSSSIVMVSVKSQTKLRTEPKIYGKVIRFLNEDDRVVADLEDYSGGFIKVCFNNECGYINEIKVKPNEQFDKFKEAMRLERYVRDQERKGNKGVLDAQREEKIIRKIGKAKYNDLKLGYIWLGITTEMAIVSRGQPEDINTSTGSWGTHEQWVYSDGTYLYFENGILTAHQKN